MKVPHTDVDGNTVMLEPYRPLLARVHSYVWAGLLFVGCMAVLLLV